MLSSSPSTRIRQVYSYRFICDHSCTDKHNLSFYLQIRWKVVALIRSFPLPQEGLLPFLQESFSPKTQESCRDDAVPLGTGLDCNHLWEIRRPLSLSLLQMLLGMNILTRQCNKCHRIVNVCNCIMSVNLGELWSASYSLNFSMYQFQNTVFPWK